MCIIDSGLNGCIYFQTKIGEVNLSKNKKRKAVEIEIYDVYEKTKKHKNQISKKKIQAKKIKPKSTGRIISSYAANKAPSSSQVTNLVDGIREHAHLRLQIFYAVAIKVYGLAKRSNGDVTDIDVWVARATKQDGQGTKDEHAAHANTAAGLSDNLKSHYEKQIVKEGITPVKKRYLTQVRNLSNEDMTELQNKHADEKFVHEIIEKNWPGNSAISGTEFEDQINATDKLPRALNIGCDLTLEKAIRPYVASLIKGVMTEALGSREATDLYTKTIQEHLTARVKEINLKIATLKAAYILDAKELQKWENQLFYNKTELEGTVSLNYDMMDGKS